MRFYTASFKTTSFTAARTLMYNEVHATKVVAVTSMEVSAPDNDTNEQLDCVLQNITSLGTPTATTVTPTPHDDGNSAYGGVVKAEVTASEPTYAADNVDEFGRAGASSVGGWRWQATVMHEWIWLSAASDWGLRILVAMGTSKALTVRMTFAEVG